MVRKSDIYHVFQKFRSCVERQCGVNILAIQTNNAKEYLKLGKKLAELGIAYRIAAPYSHHQMGLVERRYRHLINTTVTMLRHAHLPNEFWDYGTLAACYLYNKNPTPLPNDKSPVEVLLGKVLDYSRLRVFGSSYFPCLRAYRSGKLDSKSARCIFFQILYGSVLLFMFRAGQLKD